MHSSVQHSRFTLLKRATRPILRKGWWHWLRFAALLAIGSYLGHLLSESPRFSDIRYSLYQRQVQMQHREAIYPQHTVLVLLNDDDYWSPEFEGRAPTKRDQLALLLDRLNDAGANIVAFDIDLSSPIPDRPDYDFPGYFSEDNLFFAAIKRMCDADRHVVLLDAATGGEKPPYHLTPTIFQSHLSMLPCVTTGHDRFAIDMRKIPGMLRMESGAYLDSLSLAIVKIEDPVAYQTLVKDEDKGFRFARYLTPKDFEPRYGHRFVFNGQGIRHMSSVELRHAVADKAVIVGGNYNAWSYGTGGFSDTSNSPGGIEPGAMLHANYVEAELNQNSTFTPISDTTAELVEWILAFVLALVGVLEIPPHWKWGSVGVCFAFSLLLTYVLMQNLGLFLDFFIPFLMIVVHTVTEELLEMHRALKHAKHKLKEHGL